MAPIKGHLLPSVPIIKPFLVENYPISITASARTPFLHVNYSFILLGRAEYCHFKMQSTGFTSDAQMCNISAPVPVSHLIVSPSLENPPGRISNGMLDTSPCEKSSIPYDILLAYGESSPLERTLSPRMLVLPYLKFYPNKLHCITYEASLTKAVGQHNINCTPSDGQLTKKN